MKRKILCLHGRRQCGKTFAKKLFPESTISFTGPDYYVVSKDDLDFVFLNAPSIVSASLPKSYKAKSPSCNAPLRSWWGEEVILLDSNEDLGLRSLASIKTCIESVGSMDGVIGFSQGGALAASLCRKTSNFSWRPKFAVFLSSYYLLENIPSTKHFTLPDSLRFNVNVDVFDDSIRTLHAFSEEDQVVHAQKSLALQHWTNTGDYLKLSGGHAISPVGDRLAEWISH